MSIIIKGMDMPTNCADCPLSVIGYNEVSGEQTRICFVIPKHFPLTIHRLQDCPLIEIPTPHGRLIDRDAVPEVSADPYEEEAFQDTLDDMPIFLEAEE